MVLEKQTIARFRRISRCHSFFFFFNSIVTIIIFYTHISSCLPSSGSRDYLYQDLMILPIFAEAEWHQGILPCCGLAIVIDFILLANIVSLCFEQFYCVMLLLLLFWGRLFADLLGPGFLFAYYFSAYVYIYLFVVSLIDCYFPLVSPQPHPLPAPHSLREWCGGSVWCTSNGKRKTLPVAPVSQRFE